MHVNLWMKRRCMKFIVQKHCVFIQFLRTSQKLTIYVVEDINYETSFQLEIINVLPRLRILNVIVICIFPVANGFHFYLHTFLISFKRDIHFLAIISIWPPPLTDTSYLKSTLNNCNRKNHNGLKSRNSKTQWQFLH